MAQGTRHSGGPARKRAPRQHRGPRAERSSEKRVVPEVDTSIYAEIATTDPGLAVFEQYNHPLVKALMVARAEYILAIKEHAAKSEDDTVSRNALLAKEKIYFSAYRDLLHEAVKTTQEQFPVKETVEIENPTPEQRLRIIYHQFVIEEQKNIGEIRPSVNIASILESDETLVRAFASQRGGEAKDAPPRQPESTPEPQKTPERTHDEKKPKGIETLLEDAGVKKEKARYERDKAAYLAAIDAEGPDSERARRAETPYLFSRAMYRSALLSANEASGSSSMSERELLTKFRKEYQDADDAEVKQRIEEAQAKPTTEEPRREKTDAKPEKQLAKEGRPPTKETGGWPHLAKLMEKPSVMAAHERYEEARSAFLEAANDSEGNAKAKEKLRAALIEETKDYIRAVERALAADYPKKDGAEPVDYIKGLNQFFYERFWEDVGEGSLAEHVDLARELARDPEMFRILAERLPPEGRLDKRVRVLANALVESPVIRGIAGELDPRLERAKARYAEARFHYLNAFYDWIASDKRLNKEAFDHEKHHEEYEKARREVMREVMRHKPFGTREAMTQAQKNQILRDLFADEEAIKNGIREIALSPRKQEALKKAKRRLPILRAAFATLAFWSAQTSDISEPSVNRPVTEDAGVRAGGERGQTPRGAVLEQEEERTPVSAPGAGFSVGVMEAPASSKGAIESLEPLVRIAERQPWFRDWVEGLYGRADLRVVDPGNVRDTEAGRRRVMANLVAQRLGMYDAARGVSETVPQGTFYVNSEGLFFAPREGRHVPIVRRVLNEAGVQQRLEVEDWKRLPIG